MQEQQQGNQKLGIQAYLRPSGAWCSCQSAAPITGAVTGRPWSRTWSQISGNSSNQVHTCVFNCNSSLLNHTHKWESSYDRSDSDAEEGWTGCTEPELVLLWLPTTGHGWLPGCGCWACSWLETWKGVIKPDDTEHWEKGMEDENCQENPHRREYNIALSFFKRCSGRHIFWGIYSRYLHEATPLPLCYTWTNSKRHNEKQKSKKMNASHYMS